MLSQKKAWVVRKTHRYLGLIIGIQFLAWTISGLYFSWTNIDEIHGDHFRKELLPTFVYKNLIDIDSIPKKINNISLVEISDTPFYWVNKKYLYNARNGDFKNEISKEEALWVSKKYMRDDLKVLKVEKIKKVGNHHEYRGNPLPAYAIFYDHPQDIVAYVDAKSGIFQKVRYSSWRIFDFLWMGHIMDYQGRDNFNNLLLRIFSLFGIFTVVSGFLLWGISSPTLKKIFKYNG